MYHHLGSDDGFNTLSQDHFAAHLAYLQESSFEVVSMDAYLSALESGNADRLVVLTFDDAYTSLQDIVLPMVRPYQFPIAFFVPTDFVGDCNQWDLSGGHSRIEIMDWNALQTMAQDPLVTIGAHGTSHRSLGKLDATTLRTEMKNSKDLLESKLGISVTTFSFPYGQWKDIPPQGGSLLEGHGYRAAVSTLWERRSKWSRRYRLGRIEVAPGDNLALLQAKMNQKPDLRVVKQWIKTWLYRTKIRS